MPPLPDRRDRPLAGIGGRRRRRRRLHGHHRGPGARPTRRIGQPPRGGDAGLRRLHAERRHRPPRLQVGTAGARRALRRGDGPRAVPRDARRVRAGQATHRRRGDRLRIPRARLSRPRLRPVACRRPARSRPRASSSFGVEASFVPRERLREEIGSRRVPRRAGRSRERAAPPGQVLRRARCRGGARRRRPSRRRPGADRSGARPTGGWSSRRIAAPSSRRTSSSGPTATPTGSCRRCAGGSSRSAATSSRRSHSRRSSRRSSRRRAGRSSTRRTSSIYWHVSTDRRMVFGGRASFLPTTVDRTAEILHRGHARGPSAARGLSRRLRLGRQRRVHVRPDAARRSEGRRDLRDGLLRDGRRAHDRARNGGRRLAVRRPGSRAVAPPVPARAGTLRRTTVVPPVRRRVVPAPGSPRGSNAAEKRRRDRARIPGSPVRAARIRDRRHRGPRWRPRPRRSARRPSGDPIEAYLVEPAIVDARTPRPDCSSPTGSTPRHRTATGRSSSTRPSTGPGAHRAAAILPQLTFPWAGDPTGSAADRERIVAEVTRLRRCLDLLVARPAVDEGRIGVVGHDFGGMHAILLGTADRRPAAYALIAAVPRWADWFLPFWADRGGPDRLSPGNAAVRPDRARRPDLAGEGPPPVRETATSSSPR